MTNKRKNALSIINSFKDSIPNERYSKVMSAIFLFDYLDILLKNSFPKDWLNNFEESLEKYSNSLNFISQNLDRDLPIEGQVNSDSPSNTNDVASLTGEVYYELWKDFEKREYFNNTKKILTDRFTRNNISLEGFNSVLDSGCGGGRYTLALKDLGINKAIGIDVSQNSVDFANKMNIFKDDVSFKKASVLDLPFENEEFDFVFSNGVLHHTTNTLQGLKEINRVMKKGGSCWLYLYGGKDSFFWDIVDCCRMLLKDIPETYCINVMKTLGYSSGRIFHRNDFFYVPIHNRYFEEDVIKMLHQAGFKKFRRLDRGSKFDWDEIIFNNPNIDPYIYGEGEMRFFIEK
ncbi:MAG: hypothetical protein CMD35_01955 [Flavobacteriales bacterium]|nr:hypothetical protein [Flavobacteriales bacterium]